jgi:hypothetical protein
MKILVIPDIHQNINFANFALNNHADHCDRIIFLGDYFDTFKQPPDVANFKDTCIWLKEMIRNSKWKDKCVFLIGNHDLSYIFNNNKSAKTSVVIAREYYCPGITKNKINTFRKEFFDYGFIDDFFFNHFKICHKENGWIFSHAGILQNFIPYGMSVDSFINELIPDVWKNFRNICYQHNNILSGIGISRHGNDTVGGILWADLKYDFSPSFDIGRQVIGHSFTETPLIMAENTEYVSVATDCSQKFFIILDDEKIQIENGPET